MPVILVDDGGLVRVSLAVLVESSVCDEGHKSPVPAVCYLGRRRKYRPVLERDLLDGTHAVAERTGTNE
jgi:hypothetical protein